MKTGRKLTMGHMLKLGRVSWCGLYRFAGRRQPGPDPDIDLRDAIQRIALEWPVTAARGSRAGCGDRAGRSTPSGSSACCAKTTCYGWGSGSSS